MHEQLAALAASLLHPLRALVDPAERIFLPYLLSSLLLAAVAVGVARSGRRGAREGLRAMLSPRIWSARSARLDYLLLLVKAVLRPLLFGSRALSALAIAALVASSLRAASGYAPETGAGRGLSAVAVGALLAVTSFVAVDLARFLLHRAMHRRPALWAIHQLHHSAEVLTPFTLYRTHPIESALNAAVAVLANGAVMGVFVWLFGGRVRGWQVMGVDAIGFVWTLCGANLRHSHLWLSYGPRLERLLLSPAQHQVHHSALPAHHDRNFGTALALWDAISGSLYTTTREPEALRFGLPAGQGGSGEGILSALLVPLRDAWRALAPGRGAGWPSAALRLALLAPLALLSSGCTEKKFDRVALLRALGDCTAATYRSFDTAATELRTATDAAVADPARRADAQAAWRRAMEVWQQAELTQYGPLGVSPTPGAQAMREGIYSWPNVNRCVIDEQIVSKDYEGGLLVTLPSSTRGLGAMEYLLFHDGADNGCGAMASINTQGTWAALGAVELAARKAAYAAAAAADVEKRARALRDAWQPPAGGDGGFLQQLATAGSGSTIYSTQGVAFDAVAGGLFYLDTVLKDKKLARPLGKLECASARCPETVESTWAGAGRSHLAANLVGFRHLFAGCGAGGSGLGFDDLLEAAGAGRVASTLATDLDAADAAVAAIPDPSLAQAIGSAPDKVEAAHVAVKRLTDALKGEFILVLEITPPGQVAGDTD